MKTSPVSVARWVGAAASALFITATLWAWSRRFGNDLQWDEALNLKSYARHPLTALGLYHEPNNHPLDSFWKSLFYTVTGLERPSLWRLPALVMALIFAAAAVRLAWTLHRLGAVIAGVLVVGLCFGGRAAYGQAMTLRGYFMTMLWIVLWVGALVRAAAAPKDGEQPQAGLTRSLPRRFAILSALIVFTVPSNVVLLATLWPATVAALAGGPGTLHGRAAAFLRQLTGLAASSAVLTLGLYSPILIGIAVGVSEPHGAPLVRQPEFWSGFLEAPIRLLEAAAPRGMPAPAFAGCALGLCLALWTCRARGLARAAVILIVGGCLVDALLSGFLFLPDRVKSTWAFTVGIGVCLATIDVTRRLSATQQQCGAAVLALALLGVLPHTVGKEVPQRDMSTLMDTLVFRTRPDERSVVIAHDPMESFHFLAKRRFGEHRLFGGPKDMERKLDSGLREPAHDGPPWKRRLAAALFPVTPHESVNLERVDMLVIVHFGPYGRPGLDWSHPQIDALKNRMIRQPVLSAAGLDIEIFQRP